MAILREKNVLEEYLATHDSWNFFIFLNIFWHFFI
jgi:hypothetical protein